MKIRYWLLDSILASKSQIGGIPGVIGQGGSFPRVSELEAAAAYPQIQRDGEVRVRDEAIKIARDNPQQAAKLIKAWISEK